VASSPAGDDQATSEARRIAYEQWQRLIRDVGRRYADARLETFATGLPAQQAAVDVCRKSCDDVTARTKAGQGLLFTGPKGTGKDHLMVACAREAARAGLTVAFADGQTLFQQFRDLIDSDRTEQEAITQFTRPDVLLLSDPIPNDGTKGDFQRSILWRVVDRRYRDMRPTWATLNVADGAEAESKIGPQIVDRLRDGALVIACNWPSYRKAATN
jgi:DNA replication protein DnaC